MRTILTQIKKRHEVPGGAIAAGALAAATIAKVSNGRGAALASIKADWPAIAGASIAKIATPSRLTQTSTPGQGGDLTGSKPLRLLLTVQPGRALEIQYSVPQLKERINQALGYAAIETIRIVQAGHNPKAQPNRTIVPAMPAAHLSRLEQALWRMQRGIEKR